MDLEWSAGFSLLSILSRYKQKNDLPGPILPARELLADTLLDANQPREALAEYEAVLVKEPNRYRAFAGAMLAAQQAGDAPTARTYAQKLVAQATDAQPVRTSLLQARELAATR